MSPYTAIAEHAFSTLESLKHLGFAGRLFYVLGLSLWVILCGPTTPVEIASGFVFTPLWLSTAMCAAGKTVGNLVAFVLGRRLLKPLVMQLLLRGGGTSRALHSHLQSELRERPIQTMSIMRAAPLPTPFKIYGLCLFPPELVPFSTYAIIAFCFNTCWSVVWSLAGASASNLQDVLSGKSGTDSYGQLVGQVSSLVVLFYVLTQFARYAKGKMLPPPSESEVTVQTDGGGRRKTTASGGSGDGEAASAPPLSAAEKGAAGRIAGGRTGQAGVKKAAKVRTSRGEEPTNGSAAASVIAAPPRRRSKSPGRSKQRAQ